MGKHYRCCYLKDKSGVGIIVDYSRDDIVVNGVQYLSQFFSFNLRNYIFQSAKKCVMASFCLTSLHVDLSEAAKCVDIVLPTLHCQPPYRPFAHSYNIHMATIFGLT